MQLGRIYGVDRRVVRLRRLRIRGVHPFAVHMLFLQLFHIAIVYNRYFHYQQKNMRVCHPGGALRSPPRQQSGQRCYLDMLLTCPTLANVRDNNVTIITHPC